MQDNQKIHHNSKQAKVSTIHRTDGIKLTASLKNGVTIDIDNFFNIKKHSIKIID